MSLNKQTYFSKFFMYNVFGNFFPPQTVCFFHHV